MPKKNTAGVDFHWGVLLTTMSPKTELGLKVNHWEAACMSRPNCCCEIILSHVFHLISSYLSVSACLSVSFPPCLFPRMSPVRIDCQSSSPSPPQISPLSALSEPHQLAGTHTHTRIQTRTETPSTSFVTLPTIYFLGYLYCCFNLI